MVLWHVIDFSRGYILSWDPLVFVFICGDITPPRKLKIQYITGIDLQMKMMNMSSLGTSHCQVNHGFYPRLLFHLDMSLDASLCSPETVDLAENKFTHEALHYILPHCHWADVDIHGIPNMDGFFGGKPK